MTEMLEIQELTKRFGPITAVDGVSFSVGKGEVLGFLGPNGAGKSTTMKIVTGFLPPSSGSVSVCGFDVTRAPIEVKKRIGYLPEGAPLYEDMTPASLLSFVADIRGLGNSKDGAVDTAVRRAALERVMYQPIGTLSKGYKRRVGLAQAILHDPDVLILDEPTDGLDPNQKHDVRTLIAEMAKDKAIVISTHILEEVEAVCTRAIIIDQGRVVADGTPDALQARAAHHNAVRLHLKADAVNGVWNELDGLASVARLERLGEVNGTAHILVLPNDGRLILEDVSAKVRALGAPVEEMRLESGRLEEVFRQITTAD